MLKDFKAFIMRGNVLDLAVGVIIGGAFGAIVSSLVNDVLMPVIGLLTAGADFKTLAIVIKKAVIVGDVIVKPAVMIYYGRFIQSVIDFLIIAASIFLFIRAISHRKRLEEERLALEQAKLDEEKARLATLEPKTPTVEELLTDIRELLKKEG